MHTRPKSCCILWTKGIAVLHCIILISSGRLIQSYKLGLLKDKIVIDLHIWISSGFTVWLWKRCLSMIICCLYQRQRCAIFGSMVDCGCWILWNCMLKIQVIQEGSDITLVGWGAQLSVMEQACVEAEKVNVQLFMKKIYLCCLIQVYNQLAWNCLTRIIIWIVVKTKNYYCLTLKLHILTYYFCLTLISVVRILSNDAQYISGENP